MSAPESFPLSINRTGHRLRLERVAEHDLLEEWTLIQEPAAPREHARRIAIGPRAAAALLEALG